MMETPRLLSVSYENSENNNGSPKSKPSTPGNY
jgi:hypothetical protein